MLFMSQPRPGSLLNHTPLEQLKKTEILVGDPQIAGSVLGDGIHWAAGKTTYRSESVVFQVAESGNRGDPDSPPTILKKRLRVLSVIPSVQATTSAEPNAAIAGR